MGDLGPQILVIELNPSQISGTSNPHKSDSVGKTSIYSTNAADRFPDGTPGPL
jgi:hypothetical protein